VWTEVAVSELLVLPVTPKVTMVEPVHVFLSEVLVCRQYRVFLPVLVLFVWAYSVASAGVRDVLNLGSTALILSEASWCS